LARSAARTISSIGAPGRLYAMLFAMVSLKMIGSCVTMPIMARRDATV